MLSKLASGRNQSLFQKLRQKRDCELLRDSKDIREELMFFDYRHWGPLVKLTPNGMRRALGKRWGWHRIAKARM